MLNHRTVHSWTKKTCLVSLNLNGLAITLHDFQDPFTSKLHNPSQPTLCQASKRQIQHLPPTPQRDSLWCPSQTTADSYLPHANPSGTSDFIKFADVISSPSNISQLNLAISCNISEYLNRGIHQKLWSDCSDVALLSTARFGWSANTQLPQISSSKFSRGTHFQVCQANTKQIKPWPIPIRTTQKFSDAEDFPRMFKHVQTCTSKVVKKHTTNSPSSSII
jgi:hypothetical protein